MLARKCRPDRRSARIPRRLHLLDRPCSHEETSALIVTPLSTPSVQLQRLPRYFTQPQLKTFFGVIAEPRDRALFTLIYHYGLRVGEVALLRREDVDLDRGRIVVKRLKSGLWHEHPLWPATAVLIARYLDGARDEPSSPLFSGRYGALQKRQIQSRFVLYRDRAGLPGYLTCHSLRHSIATHLLDAGVSLEFVQDHLGHKSINSTSIYARITDRHRIALFRELERSPWIVQPGEDGVPASAPDDAGQSGG